MIDVDLSGRTVLVTGSARGLGRAMAVACAAKGASVAIHYNTSEDAAEAAAEEARDAAPSLDGATEGTASSVTRVQGDVTDPEEVAVLFERVEAELGPVDVLVNNVGAFAPTHWSEIDYETWRDVFATNVDATYLCSKRALPAMREQGYGRIVNIGYASADRGLVSPKNFPYFAAKASVLMFTRMLAADTSDDGITVNAISPYVIENSEEFPETLPRDRPAAFEDLIQALYFFLDPGSDYVSGENVEVDGGWLPERV
ncbi:SDR family NAD(P)-dependent oxidoreductase [Salinarchaeum laminariae]|uniref:SDR family NAD(P)-dependent oxidoreductase n=1 Tax=Salinarchaeum laminariae TaxID=869888 RepID=UPI0020BE75A2|nr:SDR family NAD(P)-dependent oxidoreductase [Salinarchaeum laminariae]